MSVQALAVWSVVSTLSLSLMPQRASIIQPPPARPRPAVLQQLVPTPAPREFLLPPPRHADFHGQPVSADAALIANWALDANDNRGRPYLIVDKPRAQLLVFDAQGRLQGSSPILLGLARGDDSVPGIGQRPVMSIRPNERTTPAGRFVGEMGFNAAGEDIVWVDYDDAISMHRVRATNPKERRLQRLASPSIADNRISYGCINVPAAFYDQYVQPAFLPTRKAMVYVLPETRPVLSTFANAYDVDDTLFRFAQRSHMVASSR